MHHITMYDPLCHRSNKVYETYIGQYLKQFNEFEAKTP